MKKNIVLIFIILISIFPYQLRAWGMTGHRVIAQIAEENIKSSTRKKINKLLDNQPMAYWANWADFIKSDKTGKWDNTYVWHYVNIPANTPKEEFVKDLENIETDNIYKAIINLEAILSNDKSLPEQKKTALLFLIHLVGDAHQPMHVGRPEDLGGNKIKVKWFKEDTNIHAVWDEKLIDYEKYSYTEYADILNIIPYNQKRLFQYGTLEDWLYDTHTICNEIYDSVKVGDALGYDYAYKYKFIMEAQLQKAGLRLASLLDKLFK